MAVPNVMGCQNGTAGFLDINSQRLNLCIES
jgi:hypothetical protein